LIFNNGKALPLPSGQQTAENMIVVLLTDMYSHPALYMCSLNETGPTHCQERLEGDDIFDYNVEEVAGNDRVLEEEHTE
jgi:hypothetical protein